MNVLIACEESQRVASAFRNRGHNAFSCDILDCSGGHPEWHIKADIWTLLIANIGSNPTTFITCDSLKHKLNGDWDLIIAHPPCTRLCSSGQRWLYTKNEEYNAKKREEQKQGIEFFMKFVKYAETHPNTKMAIENPVGIMSTLYRKPDQIYNPYNFTGENDIKKTCLWLFNGLQPLEHTQEAPPKGKRFSSVEKSYYNGKIISFNDPECARYRSQTPIGVAKAMAEQWG